MVAQRIGKRIQSPRSIPIFTCLIFLFASCHGKESDSGVFRPGLYRDYGLLLGMSAGRITGSINAFIGENHNAVCRFHFSGRITGDTVRIQCENGTSRGPVPGFLIRVSDTSIRIQTAENPGCSDRIATFTEGGAVFELEKSFPYLQIRIADTTAYFYGNPDSSTRRKAYLIKGDEARVLQIAGDWLKVEFGKTKGWMRERDFRSLE